MKVPQKRGKLGRPEDTAPTQHPAQDVGMSLHEAGHCLVPSSGRMNQKFLLKGNHVIRTECTESHPKGFDFAMAPHSSTLAWKTPWMEESGRLQSMGS